MDEAAAPSGMSRGAMVVPIAHIGALSQAWFDALGLARPREADPRKGPSVATSRPKPSAVPLPTRSFDTPGMVVKTPPAGERTTSNRASSRATDAFDRAERKTVRKAGGAIGRAQGGGNDVLRRSAGRVVIRTTRGAVRLLVQRDRGRLVITAVCDAKVAGNITAALDSARRQLRARGIAADVHTYGENAA